MQTNEDNSRTRIEGRRAARCTLDPIDPDTAAEPPDPEDDTEDHPTEEAGYGYGV